MNPKELNLANQAVRIELEGHDPSVTRFATPMSDTPSSMSNEEKVVYIEQRFREIMQVLGLDLEDDSMQRTPERVAHMYVNEIFSGLKKEEFPDISLFENKFQHQNKSGLITTKAHFNSFCEHHFLPMTGEAYIAYIPKDKVIGLSKIPRIVRYFARRPQLQERLTMQIADSLSILLDVDDVAVTLKARHYCVIARGVQDERSSTTTQVLRGQFEANQLLQEQYFKTID